MNARLLLCSTLTVGVLGLVACDSAEAPDPYANDRESAEPMERAADAPDDIHSALQAAADGDHRSDANRARNRYRNPVETLAFFGLEANHTVIEIWPGGGWYTEVLAPVLRDRGTLVAANFPVDPEGGMTSRMGQALLDKLQGNPEIYDQVEVIGFMPPDMASLGETGSADLVLLPRALHNLMARGAHVDVLEASFDVLRPGGVLGVIQHRLPADRDFDPEERTGYVPEAAVIEAAEAAGFVLDGSAEINANPLDTADHPMGVWSLPPNLRACQGLDDEAEASACREQFEAIGESDRMTMRFKKP